MDKFGVFNLINTLLSVYKNNNNDSVKESVPEKTEVPARVPAALREEKPQKNALGDRIIDISRSHDEFVARVKKAHEKTP